LLNVGRAASLGREVFILVLSWSPLVAKLVSALWLSSEKQSKSSVLSQVNHVFVVKHNKQFKSDSARSAILVWVGFSVYGVPIECGGCVLHTLIGRYASREI
jgi:hypothetical protein